MSSEDRPSDAIDHDPPREPTTPRRYRMTVAYDGSEFHGWQRQPNLRTVQQTIEEALVHRLGQPIHLQGASRTDSGVHALGQVAHFDAATRIPTERLADAINSRLPGDVDVRSVAVAPEGFDAVRDAVDKQYRYRLWVGDRRPLHLRDHVYACPHGLDAGAMHDAAGRFVGEHDFAAFAAAGHGRESTVRTVFACRVERHDDSPDPELHIVIRGSGFLWNMVRIIAGTLVEVGRGVRPAGSIEATIAGRERSAAGPTLPARGLWLEWIRYRQDGMQPGADAGGA